MDIHVDIASFLIGVAAGIWLVFSYALLEVRLSERHAKPMRKCSVCECRLAEKQTKCLVCGTENPVQ